MSLHTRYRITEIESQEIRSFPILSEIPYFLRHHRSRLESIEEIVAIVSNRKHSHPTFVHLNTFHKHRTPYAAIDALAPPLAEFFMHTDILPIVDPIFDRYKNMLEQLSPRLYRAFGERGILIDLESRT